MIEFSDGTVWLGPLHGRDNIALSPEHVADVVEAADNTDAYVVDSGVCGDKWTEQLVRVAETMGRKIVQSSAGTITIGA